MHSVGAIGKVPSIGALLEEIHLGVSVTLDDVKSAMRKKFGSMQELTAAILFPLVEQNQTVSRSIDHFRSQFAQHIETVSCSSWHELKERYGEKMVEPAGSSLEDFRKEANRVISELSIMLGQDLGLSETKWSDWGTKGYNSDVDLAIETTDLEEAVVYKTLRDCLHFLIFRGSSFCQLDTEAYVPHPASFALDERITCPDSRRQFATGEKAAITLQCCLLLQNYPEQYKARKKRELEHIENQEERQVFELLFTQAEAFTSRLAKMNKEVDFVPLRLKLAEQFRAIQQKFTKRSVFLQDNDLLYLQEQRLLIAIAALQQGGTISAGEGKVTIMQEGGQMHEQVLRERKASFSEFLQGNEAVIEELIVTPQIKRKASLPLRCTLGSPKGRSDEVARMVFGGDVEASLTPVFKRPTAEPLLMAAYEESMQLEEVIHDGFAKNRSWRQVAVHAGKYALRVTRNLLRALGELKSRGGFSVTGLLARAEKLEQISVSLEKCKRAESIPSIAATELLTDAILSECTGRGSIDEHEVRAKVANMFRNFDFGGIHFGRVMPKDEHLRTLKVTLQNAKGLYIQVESENILPILQAHAGFDKRLPEYAHLSKIHEQARACTFEKLELADEKDLKKVFYSIVDLAAHIRNVALKTDHFPSSTVEMAAFYDFSSNFLYDIL